MSTDNPFNSLGQILAEGGEIALGLAIARGWSDSRISSLFARRFEPMEPDERQRLIDLASRAVRAAQDINELPPGSSIDPSLLPINPSLYGDDPSGRRAILITEFSPDEGGNWFEARIDFADIPTMADLMAAVEAEAARRITDSPSAFGQTRQAGVPELQFRVTFGERRF